MSRGKHSNPTPEELTKVVKKVKVSEAAALKKGLKDTSKPQLIRVQTHIKSPSQVPAFKGHLANLGATADLKKLAKKIKAPSQAPVMK